MNIRHTSGVRAIFLAVGAVVFPSIALAVLPGDELGQTDAEIRAALEAAGFVIRDFDREDNEIEVDVTRNGVRMEIDLTPQGRVKSIELD